jgi:hypothetical protein
MPAHAGIHAFDFCPQTMDTGMRRHDELGESTSMPIGIMQRTSGARH